MRSRVPAGGNSARSWRNGAGRHARSSSCSTRRLTDRRNSMNRITQAWRWARSTARRRRLAIEIDEELRFHLDQQTEKFRRSGMSADEAWRQALIRFGGVEGIREQTRDEIRPALLEDSARDIRYGFRL